MNKLRIAAAAVIVAVVGALVTFGLLSPASAATTFTLNSLSATVGSNGSVTANTSVTSSTTVTAGYYGVCARTSGGSNVDFAKMTNVTFTAGVARTYSATKTFAAGTYTYFACLYSGGAWVNVGSSKTFTVGSTPTPTTTPPATSTSTSSPPPTSTSSPPPTGGVVPVGVPGSWTQTFGDEFNGTAVDTTKWAKNWYGKAGADAGGTMNGVTTYAHNVSVHDGAAWLQMEQIKNADNSTTLNGALIHTDISGGYKLPVGSYAEARVYFPGPSSTNLSNWAAWWASSAIADGWPSSGEHDIAEILSGQLTVNYHSPSGPHNQGGVSGFQPGNSWHTYGLYRGAGFADVYWDGVKVKHYTTDDNGKPEILILNVGNGSNDAFGAAGAMRVDYVRAWRLN